MKLKNGEITKEEYEAVPKTTDFGIGSAWLSPLRGYGGNIHKDDATALARDKRNLGEIQKMIDNGWTLDPDPVIKFTQEEQEEVNTLVADLDVYVSEQTLKFMYGQADMDKEWDNFQNQIKAMGADRLAELYNK